MHGGGFKIPFGLLAGAAVVVGFLVVLFTPKIYPVQRTAALPAFKEARRRRRRSRAAAAAPQPAAAAIRCREIRLRRQGRGRGGQNRRRGVRAACSPRRRSAGRRRSRRSCTVSSAKGTARFCTGSQARKATADIINYFKGIEYTNTAHGRGREDAGPVPLTVGGTTQPPTPLTPDPRVAEAIEGLMRAGYLNRGHREDIAANVPRDYKERFARIVGIQSPCPAPPWWAVWK